MYIYDIRKESSTEWFNISNFLINNADTIFNTPLCTTELKSATPTASFTIKYTGNEERYRTTIDYILNALKNNEKIHARIIDNNIIKASGYIDKSSISIVSSSMPESLSLDIRDYIIDLDENIANVNYVRDKSDSELNVGISVFEAVKKVLEFAGYKGELNSEGSVGVIIDHFSITEDDNCTYRDKIDKILFEAPGLVLVRDPNTNTYMIKSVKVDITNNNRVINYLTKNKLKTQSKIFDSDGIIVQYPTVVTERRSVYTADINVGYNDEGVYQGQILKPGDFYPENGDVQTTYFEYEKDLLDRPYKDKTSRVQNKDIDLLYVRNAEIEIKASKDLEKPIIAEVGLTVNPAFYPRKAHLLLHNNTDANITLERLTIIGDATYVQKMNKVTLPFNAKNPETYESDYIFSELKAKAFATYYYNYKTISSTVATWVEYEGQDVLSTLGEGVLVKHKGSEKAQGFVVCQIKDMALSGKIRAKEVTAIAVTNYDAYVIKNESSIGSSVGKRIQNEGQQYYLSDSASELIGGSWSDTLNIVENKVTWLRRYTRYTDGTVSFSAPFPSGVPGKDGNGISNILYYYLLTKTNTTPSLSEITSEEMVLPTQDFPYLWKKTVIVYSDTTKEDKVSVDLVSVYGEQGKYINIECSKNTVEYYADNVVVDDSNVTIKVTSNGLFNLFINNTKINIDASYSYEYTFAPSTYLDNSETIFIKVEGLSISQTASISKVKKNGVLNVSANKQSISYYADNVPHNADDKITLTITSEGFYASPLLSIDGIEKETTGANYTYDISASEFALKDYLNVKVKAGLISKELQLYKLLDEASMSLAADKTTFEFYADNIAHNTSDVINISVSSVGYSVQPTLYIDNVEVEYTGGVYSITTSQIASKNSLEVKAVCHTEEKIITITKIKDNPYMMMSLSNAIVDYYFDNVRISEDITVSLTYSGFFYVPVVKCGDTIIPLNERNEGIIPASLFDSVETGLEVIAYAPHGISFTKTQTILKKKRQLSLSLGLSSGQFSVSNTGSIAPSFIELTNNTVGLSDKSLVTLIVGGELKNFDANGKYKIYPDALTGRYIVVTISYGSDSSSAIITKTYDGKAEIVQYSKTKSFTIYPDDEYEFVYSDEGLTYNNELMVWVIPWKESIPDCSSNEYIWRRSKISEDSAWSYTRLTGVQGADGEAGEYLGAYAEAPTENVKNGDFYLNISVDGNPIPYIYKDNIWVAVNANDKNWSYIASATMQDVNKYGGTLISTSAYYGFFQGLSAQNAFIQSLGSQEIILNNNGVIQSQNYKETNGADGFRIDASGDVDFNNGVWRGSFANGIDFAKPTKFKIDKHMTQKEAYQIMRRNGIHQGKYIQYNKIYDLPSEYLNSFGYMNLILPAYSSFVCLDYDATKSEQAIPYNFTVDKEVKINSKTVMVKSILDNSNRIVGNMFALDIDKWIIQLIEVNTDSTGFNHLGYYLLTKTNLENYLNGNIGDNDLILIRIDSMDNIHTSIGVVEKGSYASCEFYNYLYVYDNHIIGMKANGKYFSYQYSAGNIISNGEIIIDNTSGISSNYFFSRYILPTIYCHDNTFTCIKDNNSIVFLHTDDFLNFTTVKTLSLANFPYTIDYVNNCIFDAIMYKDDVYAIVRYTENSVAYQKIMIYEGSSNSWQDVGNCIVKDSKTINAVTNNKEQNINCDINYTNLYIKDNYLLYSLGGHCLYRVNLETKEIDNLAYLLFKVLIRFVYRMYYQSGYESLCFAKTDNFYETYFPYYNIRSISYDESESKIILMLDIYLSFMSLNITIPLYLDINTLEITVFGLIDVFINYANKTNYPNSIPYIAKNNQAAYCINSKIFLKHINVALNENIILNKKIKDLRNYYKNNSMDYKIFFEGNINNTNQFFVNIDYTFIYNELLNTSTLYQCLPLDYFYKDAKIFVNNEDDKLICKSGYPIYNCTSIVIKDTGDKYEIALAGKSFNIMEELSTEMNNHGRLSRSDTSLTLEVSGGVRILPFISIDKNSDEPVGATFYWNFPAQMLVDDSIKHLETNIFHYNHLGS